MLSDSPQVIAFFYGFLTQDIKMTLWIGLAGTALTFLVIVPPWPLFKRNPLQWASAQNGGGRLSVEVDVKKVS